MLAANKHRLVHHVVVQAADRQRLVMLKGSVNKLLATERPFSPLARLSPCVSQCEGFKWQAVRADVPQLSISLKILAEISE